MRILFSVCFIVVSFPFLYPSQLGEAYKKGKLTNAFSECKGTINIRYEQKQRNHIWSRLPIQPLSYQSPCIRHTCERLCV